MTAPALELRNLTIQDPRGKTLVEDVSLSVRRGEPLVIIGETGSGKSLVAQAVLGLLPRGFVATGTIRIGARPPIDSDRAEDLRTFWARDVMLLPQEPRAALDPTMRVGRQLEAATVAHAMSPLDALAAVDLCPDVSDAYPHSLSGGMAQRVLVATALVGSSPLVVADEPTKGLDALRISQTLDLLRSLVAKGRSLVAITHDLTLARGIGGAVAVMKEGRIVESGPAEQVFSAPAHPYTRAWLAADPSTWASCRRCFDMDDLVLAAHGLKFGYPGRPALFDGLDVHVPRGGVLALTGPSGCGKTTLGNILLGLRRPDAGEVTWAGADPYRDPASLRRLRRRYQKLHQDPVSAFVPHRTIGRQIADLADVIPDLVLADALPPLLQRLKLNAALLGRYPGEVSGGEAQRAALARVLLMEPSLIVADEPTSRLDPLVQKETMDLLRDVIDERGMGMILIAHDLALARVTSDEIIDITEVSAIR